MLNDEDGLVRQTIARRIGLQWLAMLTADPEERVRTIAASRLRTHAVAALRGRSSSAQNLRIMM
ncbi:MAG TPA: hypothetical protein VMV40_08025 [Acidiferrobacter sp.]|nr:hypothetical protein [Acidiferrobacter sp.]